MDENTDLVARISELEAVIRDIVRTRLDNFVQTRPFLTGTPTANGTIQATVNGQVVNILVNKP